MQTPIRFVACLVAAAAALVTLPVAAQDADSQEVMRYTLTEAGLAKYTRATQNLAALPGACAEDDSDSESNSISELAGKLDAKPGAKAAVQSGGMTSREYIVFSMALLQSGVAAWGLSQPGGKLPPGVNQANVDFVNSHGAQLDQLKGLNKDCADEAAEQEPDE